MTEVRDARYVSPGGVRRDSLPWRLWERSKQGFWDPASIDFSRDAADWAQLDDERRFGLAVMAKGFMIGEEAVTLEIVPLLQAMADLGRFEDAVYLSSFAFEEAKHVDFFTRWFAAVGCDARDFPRNMSAEAYGGPNVLDDDLPRVMRRLATDRSPEAILDAVVTYGQFVEAVLGMVGYRIWERIFTRRDVLPGFQEGIALVQRDERRHIAYSTYVCRQVLAAEPDLWTFCRRRFDELLAVSLPPEAAAADPRFGRYSEMVRELAARRLDLLQAAASMRPDEIETADVETELADAS